MADPKQKAQATPAKLKFKLGSEVTNHVRIFLKKQGWVEYKPEDFNEDDVKGCNGPWSLIWQDKLHSDKAHKQARDDQRLNHFQGTKGIARKDSLAANYNSFVRQFGVDVFDFCPRTFILTREQDAFEEYAKTQKETKEDEDNIYIYKPSASARGKGIYVFNNVAEFLENYKAPCIVSQYLAKPMLVCGFKSDLRLYVAISSFWPLRCYVYRQGLVRFSTQKYDNSDLTNKFCHLTNSSINKHAAPQVRTAEEKAVLDDGAKWSLGQLFEHLSKQGVNTDLVWEQIKKLILLTLLMLVGDVPADNHCYEVFGFDVMMTSDHKPWLVEVNRSPAMAVGCSADRIAKTPMLTDLLTLFGLNTDNIQGKQPDRIQDRQEGDFDRLWPLTADDEKANEILRACPFSPAEVTDVRGPAGRSRISMADIREQRRASMRAADSARAQAEAAGQNAAEAAIAAAAAAAATSAFEEKKQEAEEQPDIPEVVHTLNNNLAPRAKGPKEISVVKAAVAQFRKAVVASVVKRQATWPKQTHTSK
mmetsp:Transcript_25964/g.51185  ORF Transcript_25964/g.51185 Transcript_25964/m.51185 type:complete len:532 (+) Transcript_25964:40-1635(+)